LKAGVSITGKSEMAYEILIYLAKNPDAQDTLEGVIEWWLLEQRLKKQMLKVKDALDELVKDGLLVERQGKDLRIHYKINRRKYRKIQKLIENTPNGFDLRS
jgi:hypothetical protein